MVKPLVSPMDLGQSKPSILLSYFEHVSIINLPDRVDRRKEMEQELLKLGLAPQAKAAEFFPAIRPSRKGDWPSLGARGGFLSHYTVLKNARDRKLRNVLVLEDDCEFASELIDSHAQIVSVLSKTPWDLLYLGHASQPPTFKPLVRIPSHEPLMLAHLYAVNRTILDRLVTFLEQVMQRPAGHPDGGPQFFDGALNMFRALNKDVATLIAAPSLASQRSSRSDITGRWFDRVPVLRSAVNRLRQLTR